MSLETDLHPPADLHSFLTPSEDDDGDTASQRSISLSSPAVSPRNSVQNASQRDDTFSHRASHPYTLDTDMSSEPDDASTYTRDTGLPESPNTSAAPSVIEELDAKDHLLPTYPPTPPKDDTESIASAASGSSRKARPESMLVLPGDRPLILGYALVDFNHLVGPRIEYSSGEIFEDEEVAKILPFLALPDGAHLSAEDYSYFHLVPSGRNPTTVFGISRDPLDRSEGGCSPGVQANLRSNTRQAWCGHDSSLHQRDFSETGILDEFGSSLEQSVRGQLTESGLYIGTNLRELVHTFRHRTLILVKALILQKRIMFYGHPVERLCTYQYSLVSLLPGLLQTLDDCGSPPLAARAPTLSRPTSLRTSDRKSMRTYTGLPLDIFGKDAFFQPYLPLQQIDVAAGTKSWLCGSTNAIVTQRKEIDLLVDTIWQTETGLLEFRDPKLERSAGLTAADRKWMDDIVKDVNEGWSDEEGHPVSINYKGSDDYLRTKFEEYISAALATVRYRDFMAKGESNGVIISGGAGDANAVEDFNPLWLSEFKQTNAYDVWERTTDPLLFDIVEPRHPCNDKPSVVADIGLRLQEGIQDLKLDQQFAPAREAVARTLTAGSIGFFKAVEGVRERWNAPRDPAAVNGDAGRRASTSSTASAKPEESPAPVSARPLLLARHSTIDTSSPVPTPARPSVSSWGSGIGSFLSNRASKFMTPSLTRRESAEMPTPIITTPPDSAAASTPSFLGAMSPAGITSPSVFPPTPLEITPSMTMPAAAPVPVPAPSPTSLTPSPAPATAPSPKRAPSQLRTLSLLSPGGSKSPTAASRPPPPPPVVTTSPTAAKRLPEPELEPESPQFDLESPSDEAIDSLPHVKDADAEANHKPAAESDSASFTGMAL
ncbi:transport protein Avl9-domain-containing protein [Roridomyces roridus]|uniref:Transport protein Avl9-domain-containing protein n=1 Tax=Roridomyces roridus TaxID=1738132 RepID=A0AAD7FUE2_9AGAR|nr:transport protein Avl9-domain-containing protein [Roridomyces roridus]